MLVGPNIICNKHAYTRTSSSANLNGIYSEIIQVYNRTNLTSFLITKLKKKLKEILSNVVDCLFMYSPIKLCVTTHTKIDKENIKIKQKSDIVT